MYSDIYCGSFKINSLGPKRLLKTQIFGAKGKLSSQEMISVFFLVFSTVTNLKGQYVKVQKAFWQLL